jgi:NADH-quinone oxidoreductase subunit J
MIDIQPIVFWVFSSILVISALAVISVRNAVHSALFLVLAFFSCAALWMLLEAEFLSLVLILVYVGAVMVLFLFVVMMLDINLTTKSEGFIRYLPFGISIGVAIFAEMVLVYLSKTFTVVAPVAPLAADVSNSKELGKLIYTEYLFQFEIAALILLVAIVAAITLTLRKRKDTKFQSAFKQVQVKKSDRLKLIEVTPTKVEN